MKNWQWALLGAGVVGLGYALSGPTVPSLPVPPAVALTLWTGGTLAQAWSRQRSAFIAVQPQVILLHVNSGGGEGALDVVQEARELIPGLRVWIQVAANTAMQYGPSGVLRTAEGLVDLLRAEAVSWNGERPFAVPQGAAVARQIVESWAPTGVPQMQSAYSSPRGHSGYPWAAFLNGDPRCFASLAQDYPFGDGRRSGMAPPGDMMRYMNRAKQGWAEAVQEGIIAPDVIRGTYVPGAHVPTQDLIEAGTGVPYVAVWPWHGQYDAACIEAMRVLRSSR